jgi:hypothetical protein
VSQTLTADIVTDKTTGHTGWSVVCTDESEAVYIIKFSDAIKEFELPAEQVQQTQEHANKRFTREELDIILAAKEFTKILKDRMYILGDGVLWLHDGGRTVAGKVQGHLKDGTPLKVHQSELQLIIDKGREPWAH